MPLLHRHRHRRVSGPGSQDFVTHYAIRLGVGQSYASVHRQTHLRQNARPDRQIQAAAHSRT